MQREIVKYYRGKNLLAKLMGQDPKTFSEKDIEVCMPFKLLFIYNNVYVKSN